MEFQTNLKKLRTEEGLTQDQLALLVETSTDTIGRIERKQKIASYEVLFRIARYFDKPVEDVFWYEWENKKRRLMLSWMWFPLMASALILFHDLSEGSKLHFRFDLDRSIFFVERWTRVIWNGKRKSRKVTNVLIEYLAVGIFAHCFMLHFRSRRGVSKN